MAAASQAGKWASWDQPGLSGLQELAREEKAARASGGDKWPSEGLGGALPLDRPDRGLEKEGGDRKGPDETREHLGGGKPEAFGRSPVAGGKVISRLSSSQRSGSGEAQGPGQAEELQE